MYFTHTEAYEVDVINAIVIILQMKKKQGLVRLSSFLKFSQLLSVGVRI